MSKSDKIPKSKNTDSERETRVLLEDIRQQVKTIAEGHGILAGKLDNQGSQISQIIRKLEEHDGKFIEMNLRFDRIEMVLTDTNDRVKTIEKDQGSRIAKLEEKVLT